MTWVKKIIPLVLVAFAVFPGCQALRDLADSASSASSGQKPTVQFAGMRFQDLTLSSCTLVFDVDVGNPYAVDIPLTDVGYRLASAGKRFLEGTAQPGGSVPAHGTRRVSLPAKISFPDLLKTLEGVHPGDVIPYTADLDLQVKAPVVGVIAIPFRKEGQVPIPAPPQVELTAVRWKDFSLEKATAALDISIVNANKFPLDLSRLGYALDLAGVPVAKGSADSTASFPAGGRGSVPVEISFSPKNLGLAAFQILSGKGARYALAGTMQVGTPFGALALPFDRSGETVFRR
jgi:LEA14-like dessication related protein